MPTVYDLVGIAGFSIFAAFIGKEFMYLPALLALVDQLSPLRGAFVGVVAVLFIGSMQKFVLSGR